MKGREMPTVNYFAMKREMDCASPLEEAWG
jgi:hypothetical protein